MTLNEIHETFNEIRKLRDEIDKLESEIAVKADSIRAAFTELSKKSFYIELDPHDRAILQLIQEENTIYVRQGDKLFEHKLIELK